MRNDWSTIGIRNRVYLPCTLPSLIYIYIWYALTYALKQVTWPTQPPSTTSKTSPSPINPNNSASVNIAKEGIIPVHPNGVPVSMSSLTNSILELGLPWPPLLTIIGFPLGPEIRSRHDLISSKFISDDSSSLVGSLLLRGTEVAGRIHCSLLKRWKACAWGRLACSNTFCKVWFLDGENSNDRP